MECLAVMAVSVGVIFVRLAMMQDLNPILWGTLAVGIYVGAPSLMIWRGATWYQLPWVWASSFIGLFVLFIVQSLVAERKRLAARGGPASSVAKKPKPRRKRPLGDTRRSTWVAAQPSVSRHVEPEKVEGGLAFITLKQYLEFAAALIAVIGGLWGLYRYFVPG